MITNFKTKPKEQKCPNCGSVRILEWKDKYQCRRCWYFWDKNEEEQK